MNKGKLVEFIRRILRKIILPIRKRKESFLSNFRFSMTFRISMNYLKLLLTHGILFMAGLFVLYMLSEKTDFDSMANDIMTSISEEGEFKLVNPYYMQGVSLAVRNKDTQEEVYNDIAYRPDSDKAFFFGIHFDRKDTDNNLVIYDNKNFTVAGTEYSARFQYDLTGSYRKFTGFLWKLCLLYLAVVALIIRKGRRGDEKLFEPVRIMSATAKRINVNNLHKERLNVAGTKNELKDLASVINDMLDRMEVSYESQKQFVSDASHELRTPIAVIQGYVNLLNRWGTTNEEVMQESIEAIQNEARSMQELVEKLLFLSRHDKKTLKLTKRKFNMKPVVEEMVKETRLVASNRIISSPVLEDVVVYGDKQALKQAIRIFIDNAVKYTSDGDEIIIKCMKVDGDCVISVQDTGIGMTRKDAEHIFDRFYRSEHVRSQNISGHGLGLSLAKLIIHAHTGIIKVRTQFTKGTTFTITIPKPRL
jgi:two-component system sensor histidine kinase ArlS